MSERQKKPGVAFSATVVLVVIVAVLLCGYAGAYLHMVKPRRNFYFSHSTATPDYEHPQIGNAIDWDKFFAPVHWIDRKIRRDMWNDQLVSPAFFTDDGEVGEGDDDE